MTPCEYVQKLGQGWNLGDTLDARARIENPTPSQQETAWHNPVTTEAMIKKVKSAGFEVLRIPTTWCWHLEADHTIKKPWLARVNEIVDYGINNGMTVILNMHHENWHFPSDENYPAASSILKKVWTQIATHFADYGDNLILESMNEPRKTGTDVEWIGGDAEGRRVVMKLNQDFVDTVRATGGNNATRMLLVPNYAASCEEIAMSDFEMPKGENIIMSLHGYIPYDFALGNDYSINTWKEDYERDIDNLFARIHKYFLSKNIPVIMGECGARNKHNNETEREKWAKYYTSKAREHGVPCIWWDNGRLEGDEKTEIFGLLNRRTLEWAFPAIVQAFVNRG